MVSRSPGQAQNQRKPTPASKQPRIAPVTTATGVGAAGASTATASAIAALFLTVGLTGLRLIQAVSKLLLGLGVAAWIIAFLANYAFSGLPDSQSVEMGPAEQDQRRMAGVYRAWYILNAIARLDAAEAEGPEALARAERMEGWYFRLHMRALRARFQASADVDHAARQHGNLLGWKAQMDSRTTLECRAANGKNFHADREPAIGWPGSVHPHCRCVAVAPFPGAPVLPSV